jgi:1-aminocyclopropane-1-carboxylate deaminase/D-cysteine desulfhydrase-like pyridoxal-dependent ACC family enzyme
MSRLRAELGSRCPHLRSKRDDYSGAGFGGNKVRKLEYMLAQAVADRADTLITVGGVRSNSCRVTAALAAKLGLECHLVLNGSPDGMPASLFLDELYGAKLHYVKSREDRMPAAERLAKELAAQGLTPCLIPLGASVPVGALGYVRGISELLEQGVRPDAIYVSSSSGGTHAGLEAGLQIFGLKETRLVGVSPDDPAPQIGFTVARIVEGLAILLGLESLQRSLIIEDSYVGPGYGIPTADSEAALRLLARTEGVVLDHAYTAKAMAAMLDALRMGHFDREETVLFWHTGGQMSLFSRPS